LTLQCAEALARRVRAETEAKASDGVRASIARAFKLTLARKPKPDELREAVEFVRDEQGLVDLCRALLNLNEFVYVD
ncbi:MAG TPA: hypothetical protein PLV92_04945, partial [Pirellulaceae bacterium]|nr:hypothetical protein [Pirellulaceae bacterium]